MAVIGDAYIDVHGDVDTFDREVSGGIGGIAKKAAALFATAFVADKAFKFMGDSISAASDLAESASKVNVVFGDAAKGVQDFAMHAATGLGQSRAQVLEATGTFGNLLRSVGLSDKEAAKFSTSMVTLSTDLASFNNSSPEEALDALRAGLVGETEPLKRFGVNMNEATLKAKAMELGLSDGKGVLDSNAKAQAAYAVIMEQTTLAQGDFARTSGGLANQQRILGAKFDDVKAKVGSALLPAMTAVVSIVADKVVPAIETTIGFFGRLFDSLAPVTDVVGNVVRQLGYLVDMFRSGDADGDGFAEILDNIFGNTGKLIDPLRTLYEVVAKVVGFITDNWQAVAGVLAAATIGASVAFGVLAASAAAAAAPVEAVAVATGVALAPVIAIGLAVAALAAGAVYAYTHFQGFRDAVDSVVAFLVDVAWPAIQDFAGFIVAAFADLVAWTQEHWEAIREAVEHVLRAIRTVVETVLGVLAALWQAWGDHLIAIVMTMWNYIRESIENALQVIRGVIDLVLSLINGDWGDAWNAIKDIVGGVWDQIGNIISTAIGIVKDVLGGVLSTIAEVFQSIWTSIADTVKGAIDAIVGFVESIPGRIAGFAANAFTAIKDKAGEAVAGALQFFLDLPGKIIGTGAAIGGAALGIGKTIIQKIGEGLSAVGGFVGDLADAVGDAIRGAVNFMIDKLNDAIPNSLGAGPFKINLPKNPIPHLASGGRAEAGRVHLVGEDGPELFVPDGSGTVIANHALRSAGGRGVGGGPDLTLVYASIDTPALLERMNIAAAVGDAFAGRTRLHPLAG